MRIFLISSIILALTGFLTAQIPQAFNYQAVLRNIDGTIKSNESVAVQIIIRHLTADGLAIYLEIHNTETTEQGLINFQIGQGITSDDFSLIDWSMGPYFLEISVNGVEMGTSQLYSVPYALYAKSAGRAEETDPVFSGWDKSSGISITESQISDLGNYIETETQSLADVATINNSVNTQLKNVSDPTEAQDAVTKAYVDVLERRIFELEFALGQDTITDYDGNYYKVVKIGEQFWMAENLKVTHYPDGTPIPLIDNSQDWENLTTEHKAFCWYGFDSTAHAQIYGALYTWIGVMNGVEGTYANPSGIQGICPDRWHIPSEDEWYELVNYLGGESIAGGNLKEAGTTHWNTPNTGATNETGFTALPGGRCKSRGVFDGIGEYAKLWTSSDTYSGAPYSFVMEYGSSEVYRGSTISVEGNSLRCVKD